MTRSELIAAMEAATGPSHDLDEEIMCCVYTNLKLERHLEGWYTPDGTHVRVEPYTSSIDAALTLVPEGWMVARLGQNDFGTWWGELRSRYITSYDHVALTLKGATPAIALCIAALKAREATDDAR